MSGPIVKKCFNCRLFLPEDCVNTSQCAKCQKNEARYGKPGTCQYCKLNAAFHDHKCVWCSHAERKFGSPFPCANCKLNCAFPRRERDKKDGVPMLCRLCILQARQTNQTVLAGIPVPPEKPASSGSSSEQRDREHRHRHHHHHSASSSSRRPDHHRSDRKRRRPDEAAASSHNAAPAAAGAPSSSDAAAAPGVPPLLPAVPNNENGVIDVGFPPFERDHGENIVKLQKMEDEIRRLKSQVQSKDQTIFEKDKQISSLKADKYNMEKKHRERVQQLIKEKEDSIRAIEQMRNAKNSKKN